MPRASNWARAQSATGAPGASTSSPASVRATSCWRQRAPSQTSRSTARASSTSWASITPRSGLAASSGQSHQRTGKGAPASRCRWRAAMPALGSTSTSSSRAASAGQPSIRAAASWRARSPSPGPVSTRARGPGPNACNHSASWGASRSAKAGPREGEVAKSPRGPTCRRPVP